MISKSFSFNEQKKENVYAVFVKQTEQESRMPMREVNIHSLDANIAFFL